MSQECQIAFPLSFLFPVLCAATGLGVAAASPQTRSSWGHAYGPILYVTDRVIVDVYLVLRSLYVYRPELLPPAASIGFKAPLSSARQSSGLETSGGGSLRGAAYFPESNQGATMVLGTESL